MWQLAEDTLAPDDFDALADWLRTYPRVTQGEQVEAFERAWSHWLGVDHSIMVTSGTAANFALLAVVARRMKRSPRVGVSAVTWSTNVTPSLLLGHELVFFDVDLQSLGVATDQVCTAMEAGDIDILLVTHLLGFNALTREIVETAERNEVVLLEDCCESHGARFADRHVGTIGVGSTFSFYFGHHMSTIEGGMVSTSDDELADELRLMRAHGLARESQRFSSYKAASPETDPGFLFVRSGLNFRATELQAFLGLRQLKSLDGRIDHRNSNLFRFLGRLPTYLLRSYRTEGVSSFALPLIAQNEADAWQVKGIVDALDIERRPLVAGNLLKQPFLANEPVTVYGGATPSADHLHACGLYVGNGHHVTQGMVDILTERLDASEGRR